MTFLRCTDPISNPIIYNMHLTMQSGKDWYYLHIANNLLILLLIFWDIDNISTIIARTALAVFKIMTYKCSSCSFLRWAVAWGLINKVCHNVLLCSVFQFSVFDERLSFIQRSSIYYRLLNRIRLFWNDSCTVSLIITAFLRSFFLITLHASVSFL